MRWAIVIMAGLALGAATAASDVAAGGLNQQPWDRPLSMLLNSGALWAATAVLAGWLVTRAGAAAIGAVAGFAVLICAVLAYYSYGVVAGDRAGLGLGALSGVVRLWLLASFVAGPLLGLVGAWTRRRDTVGLVARVVVPVGALAEMLFYDRLRLDTFRVDPAMAWTQAAVVAAAVLGVAWAVLAPHPVVRAESGRAQYS